MKKKIISVLSTVVILLSVLLVQNVNGNANDVKNAEETFQVSCLHFDRTNVHSKSLINFNLYQKTVSDSTYDNNVCSKTLDINKINIQFEGNSDYYSGDIDVNNINVNNDGKGSFYAPEISEIPTFTYREQNIAKRGYDFDATWIPTNAQDYSPYTIDNNPRYITIYPVFARLSNKPKTTYSPSETVRIVTKPNSFFSTISVTGFGKTLVTSNKISTYNSTLLGIIPKFKIPTNVKNGKYNLVVSDNQGPGSDVNIPITIKKKKYKTTKSWFIGNKFATKKTNMKQKITKSTLASFLYQIDSGVALYNNEVSAAWNHRCSRTNEFDVGYCDVTSRTKNYKKLIWAGWHNATFGLATKKVKPSSVVTKGFLLSAIHKLIDQNKITASSYKNKFKDVSYSKKSKNYSSYTGALNWAVANKIISMPKSKKIKPNAKVTMSMFATIIKKFYTTAKV